MQTKIKGEILKIHRKEDFYERSNREYEKIPRYNLEIVMGDANTKLKKEMIGNHSLHEVTTEMDYF